MDSKTSSAALKSQAWLTDLKTKLETTGKYDMFLEGFKSCQTDQDRLKLVDGLQEAQDIITVKAVKKGKNVEESVRQREEGNVMFKKRQYKKTLDLYNSSVILAPTSGDTSALALALANRSAVLCHRKLYQPCLVDIQAAIDYGYPENLRYKLYERRGKCHYQMGHKQEAISAFKSAKTAVHQAELDQTKRNNLINEYDKQIWQCEKMTENLIKGVDGTVLYHSLIPSIEKVNKQVPVMSECLEVDYREESGRGLFAKRNVEVGEVLIVEKPFASTVLSNFKGRYCHHCCERVIASTPCRSCSAVVFCSERCQKDAWESYHQFECDILYNIQEVEINLGHLAVKTVLKAGYQYLTEFEEKSDRDKTKTVLNEDGVYDSQDYRTVYDLVNHADDRGVEELLKYTLQAFYLQKCLEATDFFGSGEQKDTSKNCVIGSHILRNLMMMPCNAHECSELSHLPSNLPESVTVEIGSAIYPVLSLINHSCDPSVVRHSYGNICVVRAIRNIPKGSEVLDNYGALCALTPTAERRKKLAPQYFFTCNCLACTDDDPQYNDIPSDMPVFKCDNCAGPVFLPLNHKYDIVPCSFCQHNHALRPRLSSLSQSDETYRLAMRDVLLSSCDNIDQSIIFLENHLTLMDRLLCRPWRDFNDCQEALKQCYAYKGSHYTVNTGK
ncbi:SET and MYND domain-containing protein 4-like [Mercenaria mercenaria]|uniref:SET and MYND domain-containing protein 4-like n=1 Tax=Mercenaria mercenaria TaxID=6596 RepID=UPI001E1D7034|nr:SET and MYND domain-containing protein 4-like [Mercenaria mercenaria]